MTIFNLENGVIGHFSVWKTLVVPKLLVKILNVVAVRNWKAMFVRLGCKRKCKDEDRTVDCSIANTELRSMLAVNP